MPLAAPLDTPQAQLSGLTWCGEQLLLLPQYPRFDSEHPASLYSLEKNQILNVISTTSTEPLQAERISFKDNALRAGLSGFDGFEAIVCRDNDLWLSIETEADETTFNTSVIKAKRSEPALIQAHYQVHSTVQSISNIRNFSDETLVLAPDALISIHEANAASADTHATAISLLTGKQKRISIPAVPYRITDATALDDYHRFWVINYQWEENESLSENNDWVAEKYPLGATHLLEKNVERLIEFELTETGILRTETPPIYLELSQENGRNWEGIVRLDNLGFLLVSDEYPSTYFGFVPFTQQ